MKTAQEVLDRYQKDLERELSYVHWTNEQRRVLGLCLKWLKEAQGEPCESPNEHFFPGDL